MTFAHVVYLYIGALLLLFAALFLVWALRRRRQLLATLGDAALIDQLSSSVDWQGRRRKALLWWLAMALLVIALARPQWGEEVRTLEREGIQIMLVLDVSQSMLATDLKPDRLSRAKLVITELISRLSGDDIGLVLFSGAAFIQFPLTSDYNTARAFLDEARPGVISRPGTNLGAAIETALTGFNTNSRGQRVIVLMTDGEGHDESALEIVRSAALDGVVFFAVGFGSPEGIRIPERNALGEFTGYKVDQSGQEVISRLDEATLQSIAELGQGAYFRATAHGSEVDALSAELAALQKGVSGEFVDARPIERFQLFLMASLTLIALSILQSERRAKSRLRARSL